MIFPDRQKPFFENLDGIRFFAFVCVFFSHTFYATNAETSENIIYKSINFIFGQWGDFGLSVFFVMSGFLITYLLMHERHATGNVHVISFYVRRILRIWPLYFAIVLFNLFVSSWITTRVGFTARQLPFYFFYANMDIMTHGFNHDLIDHLWAISVEEQFYFTLPLVMLIVPNRNLLGVLVFVIVATQVFRLTHYTEPSVIFFHSFSAAFEIALGGLMAWLMFFSSGARKFISNLSQRTIIFIYIGFVTVILFQNFIFPPSLLIVFVLIVQLFGAFIILEQNYALNSFTKIKNFKLTGMLGKYSYGFFCFHILCVRIVEAISARLHFSGVIAEGIVIPIVGLGLTVLVGMVSYELFEIHFLNLKKKFTYLN